MIVFAWIRRMLGADAMRLPVRPPVPEDDPLTRRVDAALAKADAALARHERLFAEVRRVEGHVRNRGTGS